MSKKISVIGVTSEPGRTLFRKLAEQNHTVIGIGRNSQKLAEVRNEICKKFPRADVKGVNVERDSSFLLQTDILFHCSLPMPITVWFCSASFLNSVRPGSDVTPITEIFFDKF